MSYTCRYADPHLLHAAHSSQLDAIWGNKSPFSVLPRSNGSSSRAVEQAVTQSPRYTHKPASLNLGPDLHKGVHTLEEIEKEMLAAAAAQNRQQSQQQQQQHEADEHSLQRELQQLQLQEQMLHSHQLASPGLLQSPSRTHAQRPPVAIQNTATPPPRMHPHSQSPRFHQQQQQHQIHLLQMQQQQQQQQRQLLELQEQRERQQRQQLLQLQEQLKLEELERQQQQYRLQQQQLQEQQYIQNNLLHQRGISPVLSDLHHRGMSPAMGERARRLGRQSPAVITPQVPLDVPFAQNMQYLPQNIQMQQRLLAEMAQAEFLSTMQGSGHSERDAREARELQEMLRIEAMRKIMEAERMEEKRKRKLDKIAHMVRGPTRRWCLVRTLTISAVSLQ